MKVQARLKSLKKEAVSTFETKLRILKKMILNWCCGGPFETNIKEPLSLHDIDSGANRCI